MTFRFLGHTADLRMAVAGNTREELFRESLAGLVKVLDPCVRPEAEGEPLRLTLEAPDETALLVDFLGEALSRMAVEKKVYGRPRFLNLTDRTLTVDLEGRPVEGFGRDVKAVTYHEADVIKDDRGIWSTTIVFDI